MTRIALFLAAVLFLAIPASQASEGKEGGSASYAKLETFTVNLQGAEHYLQSDISLKVGDPKAIEEIKTWRPIVRHELILLLSSQNAEEIATLKGKQKLIGAIRNALNRALKLDDKTGITDVLFESFVIQ